MPVVCSKFLEACPSGQRDLIASEWVGNDARVRISPLLPKQSAGGGMAYARNLKSRFYWGFESLPAYQNFLKNAQLAELAYAAVLDAVY